MNKIEIIKKMKDFYSNNSQILSFFKKNNIEKLQDIIFQKLKITNHKIFGKIGVSFDCFNQLSIKFIGLSLLEYLEKNIVTNHDKFKIFISYDGSRELEAFYKIFTKIFLVSKFQIYLMQNNIPTNLSYVEYINKDIKFHLIINLSKVNKDTNYYQIEFLDQSFHNITNEIINKMVNQDNLEIAFNNIKEIEDDDELENINYIEPDYQIEDFFQHLSTIKQTIVYKENAKILFVYSNKEQQKYSNELFSNISNNLINLEIKSPKKTNNPLLEKSEKNKINYYKIKRVAKKNRADIIFIKNSNNIQDEIMLKNQKKYWILNYEQIAILLFDYLLKFIDSKDRTKYYVGTNYNNLDTIKNMCIKNKIGLVENMNFINQSNIYPGKLLFYFDKDNNFFFGDNIINRPNAFQLELILYEIVNYYKNQKRNINFVFNKIIKTYASKVLYINPIKIKNEKILDRIKDLFINKKIAKEKILNYEYFNDLTDFTIDKYYIKMISENSEIILYYSQLYEFTYVNINTDILNKRQILFRRKNYNDILFKYIKKRITKGT